MFDFIWFIFEYWLIVLIAVLALVILVYFGRNGALAVLFIGSSIFFYKKGKDYGKTDRENQAKDIGDKRKAAYDDIESRNTDSDDVARRMSDGSF